MYVCDVSDVMYVFILFIYVGMYVCIVCMYVYVSMCLFIDVCMYSYYLYM